MFFYSELPGAVPFGDGTLCLGGSFYRLQPPVQSDASGNVSRLLDFTQAPANAGAGMITPGSTWYTQYWYRDPAAGGAGFNLSNGLKTTFYP